MKYFLLLFILAYLSAHQQNPSLSQNSNTVSFSSRTSDIQWSFNVTDSDSKKDNRFASYCSELPNSIPEEPEENIAPTQKKLSGKDTLKEPIPYAGNLITPTISLSTQPSPAHSPRPRSLTEDSLSEKPKINQRACCCACLWWKK